MGYDPRKDPMYFSEAAQSAFYGYGPCEAHMREEKRRREAAEYKKKVEEYRKFHNGNYPAPGEISKKRPFRSF